MEAANPTFFTPSSPATTSRPPPSWSLSALDHHDNIESEGLVDNQLTNFGGSHVSQMKSLRGVLQADPENMSEKKKGEKNMRKPRYAFQTRSQVDILDDGYRWRKYGQKAVKNNKFPRSYYRCTYQGCSVKKQVQRLTRDDGVVVTTYEGMHSHPINKTTDSFGHILSQMRIYTSF